MARSEPVRQPEQAVGMALQHALNAGAPVLLTDLVKPMMVLRGANVLVQLNRPGLAVTIQGIAMDSAGLGEPVQVMNPSTRMVMTAQVAGTSTVRMLAMTAPVPMAIGAPVPPPPAPARVAAR